MVIFNYLLENFVSHPTSDDILLKIYNKFGDLVYTINPDFSYFFYKNNNVIVKIEDEDDIYLDFETNSIAISALSKLNDIKKILSATITDTSGYYLKTELQQGVLDSRYFTSAQTIDTFSNSAHTHYIASLTDVNISGLTINEVLAYNGTSWVNSSFTFDLSAWEDSYFTSAQTMNILSDYLLIANSAHTHNDLYYEQIQFSGSSIGYSLTELGSDVRLKNDAVLDGRYFPIALFNHTDPGYGSGILDDRYCTKLCIENLLLSGGTGGLISRTYTNLNLTPYTVGGIDSGSSFSGKTMTQMWDHLLYPTVEPIIKTAKSSSISGINTSDVEIGTYLNFSLGYGFNQGLIESKDDVHADIALVGAETNHVFSGNGVSGTNVIFTATTSMSWSVTVDHSIGTGDYYDSTGSVSNILDSSRVAGSSVSSVSKNAYYRFFFITHMESGSTNNSDFVRGITSSAGESLPNFVGINKDFYTSYNELRTSTNFTFYHKAEQDKKYAIYYFEEGTVTSILINNIDSSNATINLTSKIIITVNDNAGVGVNYDMFIFDLGGSNGFMSDQRLSIKIN